MTAAGLSMAPPASAAARDATYTRIAGTDRYDTAAQVAEAYRTERGAGVDTVVLVSGADEDFGYALVAPALARRHSAPMLLTEPDRLTRSAERFIERRDIDTVYIIGGEEVVSAEVEVDVERLGATVRRVAGADVHTTAAAVAQRVGHQPGKPGTYGSEGRTVLLATSDSFADGLAAGPLAYRGEHPVLLTPSDNLHPAALEFMRASDTAHAVILGGTVAISSSVDRELRSNDISTERLAGSDRFATAAAIARELQETNSPQTCFGGAEVGLANGWRPPDALVSAPLLGERCAPLLITDPAGLSSATEDLLAADGYFTGDNTGRLRITVFGGTAAISSTALSQADTAATLTPITARIDAVEGRCQIVITFSEPVRRTDAVAIGNYRHGGRRLGASFGAVDAGVDVNTNRAVITLAGATSSEKGAEPLGCTTPLKRTERFEIIANAIFAPDGKRVVRGENQRVSSDRARPRITFTLIETAGKFYVDVSESVSDNPGDDDQGISPEVVYVRTGEDDMKLPLNFGTGVTRVTLNAPHAGGVKPGDSVRIAAGVLVDLAGNTNTAATQRAIRDNRAPRLSRVEVSQPAARVAASVSFDGRDGGGRVTDALTIRGKLSGAAAGAAGNDWTVDVELDARADARQRTTVDVSTQRKHIDIVASQQRSLASVADDLNTNSSFRLLFTATASSLARSGGATFSAGASAVRLSDGTSSVDMVVSWSEAVWHCDETDGVKADRLGVDADADNRSEFYLDGHLARAAGVSFVLATDGGRQFSSNGAICDTTPGAKPGTLVASIQSSSAAALPSLDSWLHDTGGAATDLVGNQSTRRRFAGFSSLR
ncbi:cell wall-binding repeat-containing protein [Candidatus Poriferisodalis sp.]|uniref:cell wall-binding repeat-containing protein n=1 Tax=Candidatus Poriferisodalis sp. TaxID=3101277 RepID=UPI003B02DCD0